jgi:HptB-dependent secretion and biofilm anti anti-sigma factor
MPARISKTNEGETVVINIAGSFDFSSHRDFREAYVRSPKQGRFLVDLTQVTYLDSAALGMLLMLREHTGDATRVTIRVGKGQPRDAMAVAHFDKLFTLT